MEILQSNASLKGQDGIYQISVGGHKRKVYCDMTTDSGGWTAIQMRQNGSTEFNQTWNSYKNGFGEPPNDYWIGNDVIHILTNTSNHEFRVDISKRNDSNVHVLYSIFHIGDETSKYKITVSGYTGTARNRLVNNTGMLFSTYDQDNDINHGKSCASENGGGWWYWDCKPSGLNRKSMQFHICRSPSQTICTKSNGTLMMIRPKQCVKALRSGDIVAAEKIREAPTARDAKFIGNKVVPSDSWLKTREQAMEEILYKKAAQVEHFGKALDNAPKNSIFAETTYDNFWGTGLDKVQTEHTSPSEWPGQNIMGSILQRIASHTKKTGKLGKQAPTKRLRTSALNQTPNENSSFDYPSI
ncbi:angiopoietin-4-like [Ostrea edulis]|uniref:angiopoietin-4-like n=1 Tax=Ostrea edulis TaxID=37623 RepID=UPI0024AF8FA2|nr:angiopoietin-4-like [Ostrea edulis]